MLDEFEKKQIQRWCDLYEGKLTYEEEQSADFSFMFTRNKSESDFKRIFQYFDESENLLKRTMNVINHWDNRESILSDDEIINFTRDDLLEMKKICLANGEKRLAQRLNKLKDNITISKDEYIIDADTNNVMFDLIEAVEDYKNYNNGTSFSEEFYHLSGNNTRLTWYLCGPMQSVDAIFDNYFELWKRRADYRFGENEVIIYTHTKY